MDNPRRRGGLGRSFREIEQALAENVAKRSDSSMYTNPRVEVDQSGNKRLESPSGLNVLFASGSDFAPYEVSEASEYYQGPTASTRVSAHQFIPDTMGSDAQTTRGYIYVRFQRPVKGPASTTALVSPQGYWKYGPCSLSDDRTFRESYSKGRAVQALEAFGHSGVDASNLPSDIGI
jgi:hypothetical protein